MSLSELWKRKQMAKPTSQPASEAPPPSPTDENPRRNGILVNDQEKSILVRIYQNGDESLCQALGSLEMAKDVVKQQLTAWHMRQRKSPILVPSNGRAH